MDPRAHPTALIAVPFSRMGATSLPDHRYFGVQGCRRRRTDGRLLRRPPEHAVPIALRPIASIYLSSLGCIAPVMRYRHLIKVTHPISLFPQSLQLSYRGKKIISDKAHAVTVRLTIFGVLYTLPAAGVVASLFYEYHSRDEWLFISEGQQVQPKPSVWVFIVRIFMSLVCI